MRSVVVLFFGMIFSLQGSANSTTGRAVVNVGEVEANVRLDGAAAKSLFESLDVPINSEKSTSIKHTKEIACFQYHEDSATSYTCVIFIFVNKDFISDQSRYLDPEP